MVVALLGEQATLKLRRSSASDGAASVAVALLVVEQAVIELRSTSASDGVASVRRGASLLQIDKKKSRFRSKPRFLPN